MTHPVATRNRTYFLRDRNYHELRVLLLVQAVADALPGTGYIDGLGQLAKLDFLVRHPRFASQVLDGLDVGDPRLYLAEPDVRNTEAPMRRHRYGPWDERYYTVVGALLGRELVARGTQGRARMTLAPTSQGTEVARASAETALWSPVASRCAAVAEAARGLTGNRLAQLIHERLSLHEDYGFGDLIT